MRILFLHNCVLVVYSIKPGIDSLGHESSVFDMRILPYTEQKNKLIEKIEDFKPDYLFVHGYPVGMNFDALIEVKNMYTIPMIYWAVEDPLYFNEISKGIAAISDYVFTTDIGLVDEYRRMGKKSKLLLFCCNPKFHKRLLPSECYKHDIVFIGTNYKDRVKATEMMLQPLIDTGQDLMIWGNSWWIDGTSQFKIPEKYYGGFLPYENLPQVYSSAKIVIGLHLDDTSDTQTSMRTFEALGCRSFYVTQYTKAHQNLFKKGLHLEWVNSKEELIETIQYYLSNEREREIIALKGQEFVYSNHTCHDRAQTLIQFLKDNV